MKEAFTVGQVAEMLKVSPQTIYTLCSRQCIKHYRLGAGRGAIRIFENDLADYLASRQIQAKDLKGEHE